MQMKVVKFENSQYVINDVVSDHSVSYTCVDVGTSVVPMRFPGFVANHQESDGLIDEERRPKQWRVVAGIWRAVDDRILQTKHINRVW